MKSTLLVVTLLYTTITCTSATGNKTSLAKRIAKAQTRISTLSQNIKSGTTNMQPCPAPGCATDCSGGSGGGTGGGGQCSTCGIGTNCRGGNGL